MKGLVKLHGKMDPNKTIYVSIDNIVALEPTIYSSLINKDEGEIEYTKVHLANGNSVSVAETPSQIATMIDTRVYS